MLKEVGLLKEGQKQLLVSITKLSFSDSRTQAYYALSHVPYSLKEEECDWGTYRRAIYEKQDRHFSAS